MSESTASPSGFAYLETRPYFVLHRHQKWPVLLVERTRQTMPVADVRAAHRALTHDYARPGWSVIVDPRAVPGNNDPEFEAAIQDATADLLSGFARLVVVVGTAVGRLQAARMSQTQPRFTVAQSLADAVALCAES